MHVIRRMEIGFVIAFCLLLTPALAHAQTYPHAPNLVVSALRYEPYPAEPGKYVKLWISVENQGYEPAERVTFEFVDNYPFFLDESENATRYFPKISPFESALLDYKIRVASDAVEGWNEAKIRYKYGESETWIEIPIRIYVQTLDAILNLISFSTSPDEIEPGKEFNLTLVLQNAADSELKQISVRLQLNGYPIAPVRKGVEKRLYLLMPGQNATLSFNLVALPSANAGIYTLPLLITYYDSAGNRYARNETISVKIVAKPKISVYLEESDLAKNREGTVTFSIVNSGLGDAKFLKVELVNHSGFILLSPPSAYIGELSSDDSESIELRLLPQSDNLTFEFRFEYSDEVNNEYEEREKLSLRLTARESFDLAAIAIACFAIVILVVIFFLKLRGR